MKNLIYLKNVTTIELDRSQCTGCGMCLDVCPHCVLARDGRQVHIIARDACMECGACSRNCPVGAIRVQSGVGCAAAVINGLLGRNGGECCCGPQENTSASGRSGCC